MAFNMLEAMGVFNDAPNIPEIVMLDIDQLHDSEENFYFVEDEQSEKIRAKNEELKASIEMFGVLEPLLVKPIGGDEYDIVSGHRRRFISSRIVAEGKEEYRKIPCIIDTGKLKEEYEAEYTGEIKTALMGLKLIQLNSTAREIDGWQQTEQVRRTKEKLEVLKANGVKMPGGMRTQLVILTGMSRSEVGRHEQIAKNLDEEFMEAYKQGDIVKHAASELASMPAEDQRAVYEQTGGKATVKDIRDYKAAQTENDDPEKWIDEDEAEDDASSPDSMVNKHGIYKSKYIETTVIGIPKHIGNITLEMVYDPDDGLYHPGIDYWIKKRKGGGGCSPSKERGFASEEEAVKEAFSNLIKDEEVRKALIRAGYAKEDDCPKEESAFLAIEEDAKQKEQQEAKRAAEPVPEPALLKIEAAKYAIGVLGLAEDKCTIEIRYAEEQGKPARAALAAAKFEYLEGIMSQVQADLFEMTGDDMFKMEGSK